ncbi:MAG: hypothetical protein KAJ51_07350 [Thermoplasmata archaeon]|nr:hypothetical protein [Thermoplasmata archaeon]
MDTTTAAATTTISTQPQSTPATPAQQHSISITQPSAKQPTTPQPASISQTPQNNCPKCSTVMIRLSDGNFSCIKCGFKISL